MTIIKINLPWFYDSIASSVEIASLYVDNYFI